MSSILFATFFVGLAVAQTGGMFETLQAEYWLDAANVTAATACNGNPYDTTEQDMGNPDGGGMPACLTDGTAMKGFYVQEVPDMPGRWRRCVADNMICMFNEQEVCTVFPKPIGECFKAQYPADTTKSIWVKYSIVPSTDFKGSKNMIAVEQRFPMSDDCTGMEEQILELVGDAVEGMEEKECVKLSAGKAYRAFHNQYDDTYIRICEYSPFEVNDASCSGFTPYICHRYLNNKCVKHPEGGSFKAWLKDAPAVATAKPTDSTRAAVALSVVSVTIASLF